MITPEILSATAGVILSLALSYIPKLNVKYQALDPDYKRLIMLILLVVTSVGVYLLSCFGGFGYVECTEKGFWQLLQILITALVANQSAYGITIGIEKVKAKAAKN